MPWKPTAQYQRITFTICLPDGKTWEDYDLEIFRTRLNPTFLIMGKETCPTSGTKHFQGYVEFQKKVLGSAMARRVEQTFPRAGTGTHSIHYEISAGTAQQNIEYCSKEDKDPFLFGEPMVGKGHRSDLAQLFQAVREGATDVALAEQDPSRWAVHRKALSEYRVLVEKKRDWPMELIFLWGPTRTGKSAQAQHWNPESVDWTGNFLNGFTGSSETLLFDDFEWEKMSAKLWLKITDRYSMVINIKNGFKNFAPRRLIFTSNDDPKDWWPQAPSATREAVHARMDEFGKTTHLTTAQPWNQPLLSAFFTAPPTVAAAPASSGATRPSTNESDISDTEEFEHSQASAYELEQRALKRTRTEVIDLTQE